MFGRRDRETDVLIVGGGPAGLFTALSLAQRGVGVQIIDKDQRPSVKSYALALHPQSLRLLDELGLAQGLLDQGHRVQRIAIYDGDTRVAELDYSPLGGRFPFALVVAQSTLERVFTHELSARKIMVQWNHQAMGLEQEERRVKTKVARMEKYSLGYPVARSEWNVAKTFNVNASFVVGADGYHSAVREFLDLNHESVGQPEMFAVFEFSGRMEFVHEARVVFGGDTTNVVWPLSDSRGRWSLQVDEPPKDASLESFRRLLQARVPWFQTEIDELDWASSGVFERRLVESFCRGRVLLLGDAAHMTGPVGVQSMNVALREARDLAERLSTALQAGSTEALGEYDAERRKEWRGLLGVEGRLEPQPNAPAWVKQNAARLLPCIPASGEDLTQLLGQIGLRFT